MKGALREDLCTFMIMSLYNGKCFRKKNILEKINTKYFRHFFSENRAFYKIMWKNVVEPERSQMTIYS